MQQITEDDVYCHIVKCPGISERQLSFAFNCGFDDQSEKWIGPYRQLRSAIEHLVEIELVYKCWLGDVQIVPARMDVDIYAYTPTEIITRKLNNDCTSKV
jgi:hypothetical protein